MSRVIVGATIALSLFGAAGFAQASSLSSAQVQAILTLLQSFGTDQATITSVQTALQGAATVPTPTVTPAPTTGSGTSGWPTASQSGQCAYFTHDLFSGATDASTNGQVSTLQQLLGVSPVSGYFGPLTEQAVEQWQSSHGVVATGTPHTTGFGFVGPRTRQLLGCTGTTTPVVIPSIISTTTSSTPTASLTASSATIASGQSTTLSWSSTNTTYCIGTGFSTGGSGPVYPAIDTSIYNGTNSSGYVYSGLGSITGSVVVSPTQTTTYTLMCGNGSKHTAVASVTVSVTTTPNPLAPVITSISTTTTLVTPLVAQGPVGTSVTITGTGFTSTGNTIHFGPGAIQNVSSTNGTTLTFTVPSTLTGGCSAGSGMACAMYIATISPGTYSVSVTNANGTSNTVTYVVTGTGTVSTSTVPTVTLVASPTSITSGQSSTLTWSSTNATYCSGNGFSTTGGTAYPLSVSSNVASGIMIPASPTNGSVTVTPTQTTTYSIYCTDGKTVSAVSSATVTVTSPATASSTVSISAPAANTTAAIGSTLTITWSAQNAPSGATVGLYLTDTSGTPVSNYIAMSQPASGSYTWAIPTSVISGDVGRPLAAGQYKIKVALLPQNYCVAPAGALPSYCISNSTSQPIVSSSVQVTITGSSIQPAAPTITTISPTTATMGQTVTITGTGFTNANSVHIGSVWVGPIVSTNNGTTLTFVVPSSSGVCDPLSSIANPASVCTMQAVILTPGPYTITVNTLPSGATTPQTSNGVSFTVSGGASTPLSATLSASQTTVQGGQPVTLTWSSQNATYCTGVGFSTGGGAIYNTVVLGSSIGGMNYPYPNGTGATSGSIVVYPTQTTTYGIVCGATNSSATVTASAPVSVSSVTTKSVCGSANGTAVSSAPTTNLCASGTASAVTGSGPWVWSCVSSTASTAGVVSCSANKATSCVANQGVSCTSAVNSCGATSVGTVQCDGTCTAIVPPTSSCVSQSGVDLIAGAVTPNTTTVNTSVVLSAPIYNVGTASTGSGFTDRFEINPVSIPTSASSIATLRTYTSAALAAVGHNTASVSYTFPSAGTYYVRVCANTTLSGTNTIPESNYTNNCSQWSPVISQ